MSTQCRNCWNDERGVVAQRETRIAKYTVFVECAFCSPTSGDRMTRIKTARREVARSSSLLRAMAKLPRALRE